MKRERILVVEKEKIVRDVLLRMLGYGSKTQTY